MISTGSHYELYSRTRPVVLSTTEPTARTFRYPDPLSTVTLSTLRPSDPANSRPPGVCCTA